MGSFPTREVTLAAGKILGACPAKAQACGRQGISTECSERTFGEGAAAEQRTGAASRATDGSEEE